MININFENVELVNCRLMDVKSCIKALNKELCYRENEILSDLKTVIKKKDIPNNYLIYEFYNSNGEGFEGGYTPNGMSITN